ncbi:cell envelope biogenesis protein AsmA [Oceanisphaera marina]|uniref:Cell envelope biogenesis protein AsmA n=1 Tax=Oceanisphaera marina TaxID=2017550 RepID=A0ABQ1IGK7_9GAMM|nr:AsmA family protein [Oceanisphaera marina]GGB38187.1 cell envelope biogenesis protein AsmA [Oceanisphaera marina]
MKKLLYGIGFLVVLIVLALVILTQVIDADRVKRVLIEQTQEKTGRTLVINGDLSWHFFPSIGFTVTDTALLNPPGFAVGNTLSVGEISLDVALKPLFDNRLEIGEAVLGKARLHLITRADGMTNIDDLRALSAEKDPAASVDDGATEQAETTEPHTPWSISLAGVRVVDAEVIMQNDASGKLTRLNRVNFTLDDFAPDQVVPLSLSGNLFTDDIQANISATGQFWLAPTLDHLRLNELELTSGATGRAIPGNKQLKLQGNLAYDLEQKLAEFTNVTLELGKLDVTGELSVRHQAVPELRFNLHTDLLDIDALQAEWRAAPAKVDSQQQEQPAASNGTVPATLSAAVPSAEPNVSLLQNIKIEGQLAADKVRASGIEMEQLDIHIQNDQGKIVLDSVQAQLYEGTLDAKGELDVTKHPAQFRVEKKLTGVNAHDLLKVAADIDYLEGRADLTFNLTGTGLTADAIKQSVQGEAALKVADGALNGVNIAALIRRAHAKVKGLPLPAEDEVEKTDFSALDADFAIAKGKVSTNNLHMASPLLRIDGEGETNLLDESLDVLLNTAIVGSLKGQDGEELSELKNITLPVRISGTYQDPKYSLDLQQIFDVYLRDKAEKEAERVKRKLNEKLGEKLGDKLGDKLPGLLDKLGL